MSEETKKSGAEATDAGKTKGISTLALDKRMRAVEQELKVGRYCIVRVMSNPVERYLRALFLGVSPDNPNAYVLFNSHFGVKEYNAEDVQF